MGRREKVELLAPAGNKEGFLGAINAGADAVYLGGDRFGARAYADNFTMDELTECIRYAHVFGKRVYLTVNTLLKDTELDELCAYLSPAYEAGLDGVIVQDIGALAVMREAFPDMELHASTQMTLTGVYGARLLQKMGVCRIVPARELSLGEIERLKADTGLEIETFIHGAMCYCYSGQCLFSSLLGGRSGNRGRCAQPCRLPYRVTCGGNRSPEGYPLSLKDMCAIEYLPELIEAGIDSFKIEGRMKKPEYAAGITAVYRKYIDRIYDGYKEFTIEKRDRECLAKLYTRSEQQAGYYFKQNGAEMVSLKNPSYSVNDEKLLQDIRQRYLETKRMLPIAMKAIFRPGERARLTLTCRQAVVSVEGETVGAAIRQPITEENIAKQLGKLGGTHFCAENMAIELDANAFYSLKAINELRRRAVCELEDALIAANGFTVSRQTTKPQNDSGICTYSPEKETKLTVSVTTWEQLAEYARWRHKNVDLDCKELLVDAQIVLEHSGQLFDLVQALDEKIMISLPYIVRQKEYEDMRKLLELARVNAVRIAGFWVRCLEELGFLVEEGYEGAICADAGLYMWNRRTLEEWKTYVTGYCLPYELKGAEQKKLLQFDKLPAWKLVYGRLPMMVTANCVARTTDACRRSGGVAQLEDRYHKRFPVHLDCRNCLNVIYNSVPLSLHGELKKWRGKADMLLGFTIEEAEEMRKILEFFGCLMRGEALLPPYEEYTTGHEKRGVE